jgi:membrane-associated phospholipid phosphatase
MKIEATKGLNELLEHYTDLFWGVGYFGWHISSLYALYVTYKYSFLSFIIYIVVFILSGLSNHSLKNYIDEPRPSDSTLFLSSEHFRKKTNGMPSGHAQQTAFTLTLAYLLSNQYLYQSIALFLITVYQRYVFKNHTIQQLFVGSIIGFIIGYLTFLLISFIDKQSFISYESSPTKNNSFDYQSSYNELIPFQI